MADQPTESPASRNPANPFDDLDDFFAIPRIAGLVLSGDGERLVCPVQTLSADRQRYQTALWEVDPRGVRPPRRLTRSAAGESSPAFAPDGDLLFVSKRPDPDAAKDGKDVVDDVPALWLLPAGGGDPRQLAAAPGAMSGVLVARDAGTVVVRAGALPGVAEGDAGRRKARKDAGVSAILHELAPVRHWDHDLGPDEPRLFVVEPGSAAPSADGTADPKAGLRDLTPEPDRGLEEASLAISPDGSVVVAAWWVRSPRGNDCRSLDANGCWPAPATSKDAPLAANQLRASPCTTTTIPRSHPTAASSCASTISTAPSSTAEPSPCCRSI
jgi:dipeptidyl aminopeptidase/acylaminoacyl peptidase